MFSNSNTVAGPSWHIYSIESWSPMKSEPLTVSYICHLQSSLGSALAIAQVMPPWADTVWDLVGKTLETTAVFMPDWASWSPAMSPEPPPPTIIP